MSNRIYYSAQAGQMAKRRGTMEALAFLALGIGVGAAAALLVAPNDGNDMRDLVRNAMEEGYQRGRDAATHTLSQLEGEFPNLRQRVDDLFDRVTN